MTPPTPSAPSAPSAPKIAGDHFPALDAYRGIGMMMVLFAHASFATGFSSRSSLGPYISRFELAVPMFFVLSGFLLYRPFARSHLEGTPLLPPRLFLRRRALRIFPAYIVALVGVTLLFGARDMDTPGEWIINLFVLQQFGVDAPFRITQAWSIGVELSFYLLLPGYAFLVDRLLRRGNPRHRAAATLAGILSLWAIGWAFRFVVVLTAPDPTPVDAWQVDALAWLPMYLDFFALGMGLGALSIWSAGRDRTPPLVRLVGEHPVACWMIAIALYVAVAQMDPPATPFGLNGSEYLPRQMAYSLASVIWLGPAIFGNQAEGRLRASLCSPAVRWLGAISLSFYLWHLDLIGQSQRWTISGYRLLSGLEVFTGNFWLISAISIFTTGVIAWVCHRIVEMPFLELRDRPLRDLLPRYRSLLNLDTPSSKDTVER